MNDLLALIVYLIVLDTTSRGPVKNIINFFLHTEIIHIFTNSQYGVMPKTSF